MLKKLIYILLVLSALIVPSIAYEQQYDCYLGALAPGKPLWVCLNPDGGMDHSYLTYPIMRDHYQELGYTEVNNPPRGYIYIMGGATGTYTNTVTKYVTWCDLCHP